MLLKIDDPKVAHEYWQAGLLVDARGRLWNDYWKWYSGDSLCNTPESKTFKNYTYAAFICVED
jgi:hypothetical protein